MSEVSILIVGAGQIGSRHLQGLAKLDMDAKIFVVDPDTNALAIAKSRYDEALVGSKNHSVSFCESLSLVEGNVDVGIIATNARIRKKIVHSIVANITIKYLILEKIAFQSKSDFIEILQLLNRLGIQAWVNCPRRLYSVYRQIKSCLDITSPLHMSITGGNWSLGSNSIHWLDLFHFLLEDAHLSHHCSNLEEKVYKSKREGYIELFGELTFASRVNKLYLYSASQVTCPPFIHIENGHQRFLIDERNGQYTRYTADDQWKPNRQSFAVPLQSDLTHQVIADIMHHGKCHLALLEMALLSHQPLFDALADYHVKNIMLSVT
ncbi:MAG: hypothetical protein CMF42_02050 [Legionellales bacterium]|nr:hypothetical protein [Legionellales bacterium]|tara:strand:+ start:533 stop:1498 length:966 start_codon:yes stop_codon:yes gene_type:complete